MVQIQKLLIVLVSVATGAFAAAPVRTHGSNVVFKPEGSTITSDPEEQSATIQVAVAADGRMDYDSKEHEARKQIREQLVSDGSIKLVGLDEVTQVTQPRGRNEKQSIAVAPDGHVGIYSDSEADAPKQIRKHSAANEENSVFQTDPENPCAQTCFGNYPCDSLLDQNEGLSCEFLLNTLGCDCTGCGRCAPTAEPTPSPPTSTPTASPTSDCAGTYQAEDAHELSGVQTRAKKSGFTGSGYVDYVKLNNDFIEWNIESCAGGSYDASFRYALKQGNRPLKLVVNGDTAVESMSFPASGSWTTWTTESTSVSLPSGDNTIKLVAIGSSGGNVDKLTLTKI